MRLEGGGRSFLFTMIYLQYKKYCSTGFIQALCPDLFVEFIHGQEPSAEIEKKMSLFVSGKIDVLVCTSIIESGIDVPNANCIIINNSHLFGLSQLYQMRGRVGRGVLQAYAYLLVPCGVAFI